MPHICVIESDQHWFRKRLVAYSAPIHYLNQCCFIVNCALRNKLQWNINQNTKLVINENASEYIVWEMVAIWCQGRWVKKQWVNHMSASSLCICNANFMSTLPVNVLAWTRISLTANVKIFTILTNRWHLYFMRQQARSHAVAYFTITLLMFPFNWQEPLLLTWFNFNPSMDK